MDFDFSRLVDHNYSVKKRFLGMYRNANAGHVGSSLSCAEVLVFLTFRWMRPQDTLILSKGHAAAALYSILAEQGKLSEEDIHTFCHDGTILPAHPPANLLNGLPFATGSLGHGLSLAAGMALASHLKGEDSQYFCVTSDGELNEGSVWEAALFISHHSLSAVTWVIDRNRIQAFGRTEDVLALEPLQQKLEAFGFLVAAADGHDFRSLESARKHSESGHGDRNKPAVIVANTIKGRGIPNWENTVPCHYLPLTSEQYGALLTTLEKERERLLPPEAAHAR